ncbi:secretogranin-1 [Sceloporus undulatus]|uniref:secretogranin-1 n=1 Tax=Sceloporus undulatus TaxID=8520 RepID=UPI001C4BD4DA|nr:secretogranin-1 [Sceloporus undulatus]
MVPSGPLRLLSLFGAALALVAGVHSVPVEKDDHVEEMVTRCIVEVLLNGLSKANAPPINPQCKELLKERNQQKEEDKDGAQVLEPLHLSEPKERENPKEETMRGEQGPKEDFKRQAEVSEKWHPEGKLHGGNGQTITHGDSYSFDEAHKEETKDAAEKGTEEDGSYKRNYPSEEESKSKKHSEDLERELQDKPPGKAIDQDDKRSGGQREEIMHSQERENEESKEEEDAEEEEEEESSEKYHHSFHREYEDSSERDVDTDKRGHRPKYYYRKPRLGNSSEYKGHHYDEKKDSPEESSEEEHGFWDKRGHYPKYYYQTGHRSEEKRNSVEMHGSEEIEGKSRDKEHQDKWHSSREDNEEEDMRHHSRENEEKQHRRERKRLPDEPEKLLRHYYEERAVHSKPSEEDVRKEHSYGGRDENNKEHLQLQLEEMPKLQNREKEDRELRLYTPEEGEREEKRHYPSVAEEELEEGHYNERGKHVANKRTLLLEDGYPRSHYLVENVKRAVAPYIPYYQQFRWKNRHAEKKDDVGNPFLESEEEPRSQMNERDFFPEYNDYDLWEKKQLTDGLGHKHSENNNLERSHKFDVKRQYNKMDQLAHLLSNKKKSAEFPEFYSSREDVKRGHIIRGDKGKLRQRPLTQEEEKELENLAAMDLELQKIAEKFNTNRRG